MCGIAGIVGKAGQPVAMDVLRDMTRALGHRGPDDHDTRQLDGAGLGHRRLSIVDLTAAGRQPMSTEDGRLWTVYNGEIYNHVSLRRDLEKLGYRFHTKTDTEVLLNLYREYGDRCVERLRGMFAFAIWDCDRRRLLMMRDRFGQKPLYYMKVDSTLVFSSELRSLARHPDMPRDVDPASIHRFLSLDYIPAPETVYRGVYKLPAAHGLVYEDGQIRVYPYWRLDYGGPPLAGGRNERREELLQRFDEAVKLQLMGEVPVGVFLSGGIDSNSIAASISGITGQRVETFSIGFSDPEADESGQARDAARFLGTRHHERIMEPRLDDLLPRIVSHFGEPFGDPSALPTWSLAEMAGEHITVALSGEGGDEALAGYPRYPKHLLARRIWMIPPGLRRKFGSLLTGVLPDAVSPSHPLRGLADLLAQGASELPEIYGRWLMHCDPKTARSLYATDFSGRLELSDPGGYLRDLFSDTSADTLLNAMLDVDQRSYLADCLLPKLDMCTMAHSVEGRSPFLDHELAEFMARLPERDKLHRGEGKWLFRRALADRVAPGVMHRPKRGFGLPLAKWLSGPLQELLRDTLGRSKGFFRTPELERLLDRGGPAGAGWHPTEPYLIWNLLVLELWQQQNVFQTALSHSRT